MRCRMFPSLINCCTIDWYSEWPREALLAVAERYFANVDIGNQQFMFNPRQTANDDE